MLALLIATALGADPAGYAGLVREQLQKALPAYVKADTPPPAPPDRAATASLELEIGGDGAVTGVRLAVTSGVNKLDDWARGWVLLAEPLPAPPPELVDQRGLATCLVRLGLAQKPKLVTAHAACIRPKEVTGEGDGADLGAATDPGALLLAGWAAERAGNLGDATRRYQQALSAAPRWDLAARAVGLLLVKQKRAPQAIPYLRIYANQRLGAPDAFAYAREIERFEKEQAQRAADFARTRARLSQDDIMLGVKKGYALLEPCLQKARTAQALALGADTLFVSWRVKKDGSVDAARLEGPDKLMMTEHAECIERSVQSWRFPPFSEGTEVTAKRVPIKVKGSSPPKPPETTASSTTPPPPADEGPAELALSTCERAPEEVTGYIQERTGRLLACIDAERKRTPAGWPDSLPIAFVVDAQGPVRNVFVNHRAFRTGPLADCMAQALAGTLAPSGGADCPAEIPIDLRGLTQGR